MVTYFVSVGSVEIRVQQEAADAFERGQAIEEGAACGLRFQGLRWFDAATVVREA
jgi:hypothetical protein